MRGVGTTDTLTEAALAAQQRDEGPGHPSQEDEMTTTDDTVAPECEGDQHRLGTYGHDQGPATHRCRTHCQECGFTDVRLLCSGRVGDMLARRGLICSSCRHVYPNVQQIVSIEALEDISRRAARPLASVDDTLGMYAMHLRAVGSAETTIRNRLSQLAALEAHAGAHALTVDTSQIVSWLGRDGLKPSTRRTHQVCLKSFYAFARSRGYRSDDPSEVIPTVRVRRGKPRPFTREQIDALLAGGAYRRTRAMIILGYYQGFRVSSIARVNGADIDRAGGTIRSVVKGGRDVRFPLHPVTAALATSMPTDGYWFPGRTPDGGPIAPQAVSELVRRAKTRAGITDPRLTAHSLRHSFATHLLDDGVDIRVIQELMAHENLSSTQVYAGVSEEMSRAGIVSLASRAVPDRSGRGRFLR